MTLLAAWAGGRLLEPGQVAVAPDDPAFTVGCGLFETLRVNHGVPDATTAHLRRLLASADVLGFDTVDVEAIETGTAAVLQQAPEGIARLRYTVSPTGGVVVTLATAGAPPSSVRVVTAPWPRNEASPLVAHKTTSYGECAWALQWAQEAGADEALFRNTRGHYCEGATSNVFVVRDGAVSTPPLEDGLLAGVTRAEVLRTAERLGHPVRQEHLPTLEADEVFLTSSLKGVVPVSSLDGRNVPVGPVTAALRRSVEHPTPPD